jgi:hypothetical protein
MALGFAHVLSKTLTLSGSTVLARSVGVKAGLTGRRGGSMNRLAGDFNGLTTGLRMPFARKIRDLRVSWGQIEAET